MSTPYRPASASAPAREVKAGEVDDRIRHAVATIYQTLIGSS
jgi:hypothetical protein